ncbi:MAG: A24 family peptidase [Corynebacterium sp.]|nr:A24 family peptidase [Corynebacterium sp.]
MPTSTAFWNAIGIGVIALWALLLSWWDITKQRLPNWLTVPPAVLAIVLAVYLATVEGNLHGLWGLIWPCTYLMTSAVSGGIGGGDIKLAVSLGIGVAFFSGILGVIIVMGTASVLSLFGFVFARFLKGPREQTAIPHGPGMLLATYLYIIWGTNEALLQ